MRTIEIIDDFKINPKDSFIEVEKRDKRLTIVTTKSMLERIKKEAEEKNISYSEIMNRALAIYFKK